MSFIVLFLILVLIFGSIFGSIGAGFVAVIGLLLFCFIAGTILFFAKRNGHLKDWDTSAEENEARDWALRKLSDINRNKRRRK